MTTWDTCRWKATLTLSDAVMPFGIILLILFFIRYSILGLERGPKIVAFLGMERVNPFQPKKL
jgi:hypothetical protein